MMVFPFAKSKNFVALGPEVDGPFESSPPLPVFGQLLLGVMVDPSI